ncbi:hypothetical protein SAMN06265365_111108 [Tistlia consotensis]|uniref:MSP domain-containing protein n=1 Tax=Tistlia consotensis USBA 355 TaxID=560819 RepID=A0A1Y6C2I8_9PROT|nr:hypothetical protein [Tistlia consotensis]SMF33238.1 hypothetical protein SAMN05428998_111110 [Tistlia consotensis USBA 355]SNR69529.1 hypothetical protein SAMN06265365_111108 [Tistlia consotensis]
MPKPLFLLLAFALLALPQQAAAQAGLLTGVTELAPIKLSVMAPMAEAPYELEAGKYYRLKIVCDGSGELGLSGAEFFRNLWINEVVIDKVEVRPLGLDSIEFDDAGTATITFVPIRPGRFVLRQPGTTAESQQAVFLVK